MSLPIVNASLALPFRSMIHAAAGESLFSTAPRLSAPGYHHSRLPDCQQPKKDVCCWPCHGILGRLSRQPPLAFACLVTPNKSPRGGLCEIQNLSDP